MNEYRDKLIKLYLKTESDIINEIARLRSLGFADYHVVAALKRVRQILNSMKTEAWEWSPKAIEYEFYAYHPDHADNGHGRSAGVYGGRGFDRGTASGR